MLVLFAMLGSDAPARADPDADAQVRRLVERAGRGDRSAFDQLFRLYVDDVYRWLTRLVGPVSEREDLVQETFIGAYRNLPAFRGEAAFSSWLYRIVVNQAYSHLRRRRGPGTWSADEVDRVLAGGASPEATTVQRDQVGQALLLLDRLKPKKRIAFVLRVVEGMSLQEIADITGATPAAAGQRVKHAHRELLRMVEQQQRRERRERKR